MSACVGYSLVVDFCETESVEAGSGMIPYVKDERGQVGSETTTQPRKRARAGVDGKYENDVAIVRWYRFPHIHSGGFFL